MQNALAEQPVRHDTLGGTTTISLRATPAGAPGPGIPEIEVIPEDPHKSSPINELDAIFCRDLLEFVGDFRSAAPRSSTVRRSGQAAATGTPGTRDPALGPDALFEFLRAYGAAPKMRPLSLRPAQEPAVKSLGPTVAQATVDQPEDTPFRVPPYVSAVPESTPVEEALFDPEAVWFAPQPTPAPVVEEPVVVPVTASPVAKRPARARAVKRPGPEVVAQQPSPVPVAESPAPAVATKRPDPKPAPAQIKRRAELRPAPVPAVKPLGAAAARAKAIEDGLIV
jgi:hypothetical protein